MKEFRITITGKPVPCGRPRATNIGKFIRFYPDPKSEKEQTRIAYHFIAKYGAVKIDEQISMIVNFFFKGKSHGDIDNLLKTVFDSFKKVFNDRQIMQIYSRIWLNTDREETEIVITPFEQN